MVLVFKAVVWQRFPLVELAFKSVLMTQTYVLNLKSSSHSAVNENLF